MKKQIISILLSLCIVFGFVPITAYVYAVTVDSTAKSKYEQLVKDGILPNDIPFDNFIDVSQHQSGKDINVGEEGVYFITGKVEYSGKDPARINVGKGVDHAVAYFYNCYMDYSGCSVKYSPVTVNAQGTANFYFIGENTFIGAKERPGIEKNYKKGGGNMRLWLLDDCNVTATGGEYAAGIGSAYYEDGGDITIESKGSKGNGKLKATGTNGDMDDEKVGGAGIGSSADGSAYNITINGGDVTAKGGLNAAGIGSGYNGDVTNITIIGGKVNATSPGYGAGIGTGSCSKQRADKEKWLVCKNVYISGGNVSARGGNYLTAAIGGGVGGKAEDIRIVGGNVSVAVKAITFGRVIGGGQDCTDHGDISENITASLSEYSNKGQYFDVTFVTEPGGNSKYVDVPYRIYPGETFDIKKTIQEWYVIKPEGSIHGTYTPAIVFKLINCTHTKTVTEDGVTTIRTTDYYKTVGNDRVHFCNQCGSVLDYDNTYPKVSGKTSKSVIGDWNFNVSDPEPSTFEVKKFSFENSNGNTVEFFVSEKPSGIDEVLLDGNPLKANKDGSYTIPGDSSLPDNIKKHTLVCSDRSGKSIMYENFTVYESITVTAFCDDKPMLLEGIEEKKVEKGWECKLKNIINPSGYNGYYKIYKNGEFVGTCINSINLGRFYTDTKLEFYTEQDTKAPTGEIKVCGNSWTDFESDSRPKTKVFINSNEKVTITAQDLQSGIDTVKYLTSSTVLSKEQLENESNWIDYTEPFEISVGEESYVYAKITDKSGKSTYINTSAIKAITTPISIVSVSGNPDKWQSNPAEIQLTTSGDCGIASALVYIDDNTTATQCTVTQDNELSFTAEKNGSYKVVVTDLAGNTAQKTIKVERIDSSIPTITFDADADTARKSASVTINVADSLSGYKLYLSHNGNAEKELTEQTLTITENGTYTVRAVNGAGTEYTKTFSYTNIDNENPIISGIENGKIYCEEVSFSVTDAHSVAVTVDGNELSPNSDGTYTVKSSDLQHSIIVTDLAGNKTTVNVTVNSKHTFGEWKSNGNGTHTRKCTVSGCNKGTETENCNGGKATCNSKAKCEVCGESYGKINKDNHSDLKHFAAKSATKKSKGNIEYWYCKGCNKYFSNKKATKEISKSDTVIEKLKDTNRNTQKDTQKSPQTGDNGNILLLVVIMLISGVVIMNYLVVNKKNKQQR